MEYFLNKRVTLHCGDCREVLRTLPDNSIDSVVTDPPYHLQSVANASSGFMGKKWDGGDIAFNADLWRDVLRVLKPGAHLLAFGGDRTFHRLACAVEDAGFEIRGTIAWIFGQGFPKNFNALKPAMELIVLARKPLSESTVAANVLRWGTGAINVDGCRVDGIDAVEGRERHGGGAKWEGSNFADRKSPMPPGRWPANVIHDGSEEVVAGFPQSKSDGGMNPIETGVSIGTFEEKQHREFFNYGDTGSAARFFYEVKPDTANGRWPANVIHDGSDEVMAGFPETASGTLTAEHRRNGGHSKNRESEIFGKGSERGCAEDAFTYNANSGSAARFYYTAKADDDDRLGSSHPTVKPVDLMQYLTRLITPPCGLILDLFAGTGTTGEAAWREGFRAVLIENEPQYQNDIRRRMKLALAGPDERKRESVKARGKPVDLGPLFANREAAE